MRSWAFRTALEPNLHHQVIRYIEHGEGNFADLLVNIHRRQRELCHPYHEYCKGFPAPSVWREIPPLPLGAFRWSRIATFPESETARTFRTSGTTGEGYGQHHFATLDVYHAAAMAGWRHAGIAGHQVIGLVPPPTEAPHSSLSAMAGWLVQPEDFFWNQWERLANFLPEAREPIILFGTALGFLDFFEFLGDRALTLPAGSAAMETGGYKGTRRNLPKEELYGLFEKHLGLAADDVWNEYGMTELSSQFYTRGLGAPHRGGSWVRGLVIDPSTGREVPVGETGVLVIFDLANIDSSCVLQTQDLAIRHEDGFLLLGRDPSALPRGCSRAADDLLSR